MARQRLTLTLAGITAGDYLQWVRDPEPPALGRALQSIEIEADPLGQTVEALLSWNGSPPPAIEVAAVAGLPLTPDIAAVDLGLATVTRNPLSRTTASSPSPLARARSAPPPGTPTGIHRRARRTPVGDSR